MQFKFDLQNDNFRRFFDDKMMQLTKEQRSNIPPEMLAKIFKRNGKLTNKSVTFLQQLYMLNQSGVSNIFIVVEDQENGIPISEFETVRKEKKIKTVPSPEDSNLCLTHGTMVMAGKDIIDYINKVNAVSLSAPMNYALKLRKTQKPRIEDLETEFKYFTDLLVFYEGNKKKFVRLENLNMPDWYVLLAMSDGEERNGTILYRSKYVNAVNSSRVQLLNSFKKLIALGYISTTGRTKSALYKITALGRSVVRGLIKKYVIP